MDEIMEMIKNSYQELQRLEIVPTKNNMLILLNALSTLENCFTVMSKAKVVNNETKEEPEDVNNVHESES